MPGWKLVRVQKIWPLAAAAALLAADIWLGAVFGWPLAAAGLFGLAGWAAFFFYRRGPGRQAQQEQLEAARRQAAENERRLRAVQAVSRGLAAAAADAIDERGLVETCLAAITEYTGALGCSFVPVDEWRQPLPAHTAGQLPAPVLSAWSMHLASGMLRERCGACKRLNATPGNCPLHPQEIGGALTVHCLPLDGSDPEDANDGAAGEERHRGVLHLYLPAGRELDLEARRFLAGLLPEIAAAYESARLRSQELSTMRQLRLLHSQENDFSASLGGLLDGLLQALEADFVLLRLRPAADERASNLNVQRGALEGMPPEALDDLFETALAAVEFGRPGASQPGSLPAWLALPLLLPDLPGQPARPQAAAGVLLVGANRPFTFHPRQQAILQTVASQAALLVENERMIRSLEYKVVIQERARLAREIHDGLAQTLAFLKLQAAQMQSYLAQGDTARLAQVLRDNYQALAEAYLDTRQAIDNLRLTPQEGLESWMQRTLSEFENTSGLRVEQAIQPLNKPLAPEVQAQLMRIVQEALNNVRKHARADRVRVSLRSWSGELILEVSDDGQGFDAEDVPEFSQHGLRGMRERAEMIGADFQIISQARQGTTVRLSLPAWCEEEPSL